MGSTVSVELDIVTGVLYTLHSRLTVKSQSAVSLLCCDDELCLNVFDIGEFERGRIIIYIQIYYLT